MYVCVVVGKGHVVEQKFIIGDVSRTGEDASHTTQSHDSGTPLKEIAWLSCAWRVWAVWRERRRA